MEFSKRIFLDDTIANCKHIPQITDRRNGVRSALIRLEIYRCHSVHTLFVFCHLLRNTRILHCSPHFPTSLKHILPRYPKWRKTKTQFQLIHMKRYFEFSQNPHQDFFLFLHNVMQLEVRHLLLLMWENSSFFLDSFLSAFLFFFSFLFYFPFRCFFSIFMTVFSISFFILFLSFSFILFNCSSFFYDSFLSAFLFFFSFLFNSFLFIILPFFSFLYLFFFLLLSQSTFILIPPFISMIFWFIFYLRYWGFFADNMDSFIFSISFLFLLKIYL